jgi:hypothetical protein
MSIIKKSAQVWRTDNRDVLLLGQVGRDWYGIVLYGQGHNLADEFTICTSIPGYTSDTRLPNCYYWVFGDAAYLIAENPQEYFKKMARRRLKFKWETIWQ